MRRNHIHCKDMTQSLLIYTERQQRLYAHIATNIHRENREAGKVGISWFLPTFPELTVNLMCQLTVEIS